ncbi:acyltransferase [Flavisolibacter sp. BT320]|nr:acyltransferase [Flavisolibacter longurius]
MNNTRENFPALTGIRFLAASMVFLFHYADLLFPAGDRPWGYFLLRQLNVGVTVFFVLSGFLITHCYYSFLTSGQPLRQYFIKRIARIFPLYWAVLFANLALKELNIYQLPDAKTLLLNLSLLHGLSSHYIFSGLTQSWSLTVEETFYLFAPLCFALIRFWNLFWLQVPLLLGVGLLFVWLSSAFPSLRIWGNDEYLFSSNFFGRCFEFFAGIFVCLQLRKQKSRRSGIVFTLFGTFSFVGFLIVLAFLAWWNQQPSYYFSLANVSLFNFLLPCSIAIFYYGLLTENTILKKFLSSNLLELLGKSSYAFYLLHIGMVAEVFFFHVTRNLFLLYLVLQLVSVLAYKFFEKPVYFSILKKFKLRNRQGIMLSKQNSVEVEVGQAKRTSGN